MASALLSSLRRRHVGATPRRAAGWKAPVDWASGASSEERLDTLFGGIAERLGCAVPRPSRRDLPVKVGPWMLGTELGQGSSGTVHAAVHADDGRPAAVKLAHRPEADAFTGEAAMLGFLAGPSVASLLGSGVHDDGRPYIAMARIDGRLLAQDARRRSGPGRLRLFLMICAAVDSLHRRRVVHADLKPGHVSVCPDGRVVLLDVGSAIHLDDPLARPGRHPLTPEFAAPEQIVGQPLSRATDVYALGLLLHEILCGRQRRLPWALSGGRGTVFEPLVAPDLSAILQHRRRQRATGAARMGERLDWRVESVLDRALQTEPEARYATAGGLARALHAAIDLPTARS